MASAAAVSAFRWVQKKERRKEGAPVVQQEEPEESSDEDEDEEDEPKEKEDDMTKKGKSKLDSIIKNVRDMEKAKAMQEEAETVKTSVPFAVMRWLKSHGKSVPAELSKKQRQELTECFNMIDADGSGAIDAEEMQKAFIFLGIKMSVKEVEAMFAEVDEDGSGEIEFEEFVEVMTSTMEKINEGGGGEGSDEDAEDTIERPLPFPLMAMAYRRRKLMEATFNDEDRKNVIAEAQKKQDIEDCEAMAHAKKEYERLKKSRGRRMSMISKLMHIMDVKEAKQAQKEGGQRPRAVHYPGHPMSRAQFMAQNSDFQFTAQSTMVPKDFSHKKSPSPRALHLSQTARGNFPSQTPRTNSCSPAVLPPVYDSSPISSVRKLKLSPYARAAIRAQVDFHRGPSEVQLGLTPVRDLKPVRNPLSHRTLTDSPGSSMKRTPFPRPADDGDESRREKERESPSSTLGKMKLRPGVSKAIHTANRAPTSLPPLNPLRRKPVTLTPRDWVMAPPSSGAITERPHVLESWTPRRDLQTYNSHETAMSDFQVKQLDFKKDPFAAWETTRSDTKAIPSMFHPCYPRKSPHSRVKKNQLSRSSPTFEEAIYRNSPSPSGMHKVPTV